MTSLFFDEQIMSPEFKTLELNGCKFVRIKRSKFLIKIPDAITFDIAYLVGAILGDGNLTITNRKISKYPRVKIRIFNSSRKYLSSLSDMFERSFCVRGKIYRKAFENCYVLDINNKIVWLYFVNVLGLKPKRKIFIEVPELLTNRKFFHYFVFRF